MSILLGFLLAALLTPLPATALTNTIAGTVLASDGETPLAGVHVYAQGSGGGWGSTSTADDGTYQLVGLSADEYRVYFDPSGHNQGDGPDYAAEYYDAAISYDAATPVQVGEGQEVGGVDATLALAGSISGTVLASDGETPLAGVQVYAEGTGGGWVNPTETGLDGSYEVSGLSAGEYRVRFDPSGYNQGDGADYVAEYFNGTPWWDKAELVMVDEGQGVNSVDATLTMAGSITGTVLASDGVTPLPGVQVSAQGPRGGWGSAYTADDGTYALVGLSADEYRVQFDPSQYNQGDGPDYAPEYYSASVSYDNAAVVQVNAGETVAAVDATLALAGSISGTVLGSDGTPLPGVFVYAYSRFGSAFASTDQDGSYQLSGLSAGEYRIQLDPSQYNQGDGPDYAAQYYPQAYTYLDAGLVTVASGDSVTDVNTTLAHPGSISGTVRAEDGSALGGVEVHAFASDGNLGGGQATTGEDGTYTITGLVPSNHTVRFDPSALNQLEGTDYLSQTYRGANSWHDGEPVAVRSGEVTPGIDAALGYAGSIAGTVTDADAQAMAGVMVTADGPDGAAGSAFTDENGSYVIPDLAGGDYLVSFDAVEHNQESGPWYAHEYYEGATDPQNATLVTVTPHTQTGSINATLDLTTIEQVGWITGKVYGPDGTTPLEGIMIGQSWPNGDGGYGDTTDAEGSYRITTRPGAYAIYFLPDDYNASHELDLRKEYYNNAASFGNATTVYVVAGVETRNSDVVLDPLHNTGPTIDPIEDVSINELTELAFQITATDLESQPITYAFVGTAPQGATMTPGGVFSWTPSEDQGPGTYEIVVAASDGSLTSTSTFTVTVNEVLAPITAGEPTITGTAAVGYELAADPGTWAPDTAVLSYQWYRNDDAIDGATSPIYVVQEADAGTSLMVKVTGTLEGYLPATASSAPTGTVPPLAVFAPATPTIKGAAKVGSRLTVNPNLKKWLPQPITVTYQWSRACPNAATTPIPDADSAEYVTQPADAGCQLIARVTGATPGYATAYADSATTPAIKPARK